MTKEEIQRVADEVCDKYRVKRIPIKTTNVRRYKGGMAYYATYKTKIGGKISKENYPRYIMICDWDMIKKVGRFPILQVAHELAHHIMNMKTGSLKHISKMYDLEEEIGLYISRKLKKAK